MKQKKTRQALIRVPVRRTILVPQMLGEIIRGANSILPSDEFPRMEVTGMSAIAEQIEVVGTHEAILIRSLRDIADGFTLAMETLTKFSKEKFPVFYELTGGALIEKLDRRLNNKKVFKNVEIHGSNVHFEVLWRFFNECRLMADAREILRKIARHGLLQKGERENPDYISPGFNVNIQNIPLYHQLVVNAKGLLEVWPSSLSSALTGVQASRIRLCQNCGKIYWAGRKDQPCCSKNCANTRRVKHWYQEKDKYKENRCYAEDKGEKAAKAKKR